MSEEVISAIQAIKKYFGVKFTRVILQTDSRKLLQWSKGQKEPNEIQRRLILHLWDITNILSSYLPSIEGKVWMVSHSDYLYGIPAIEINTRPLDVRLAALDRVADFGEVN